MSNKIKIPKITHTVFKNEDIINYLKAEQIKELSDISRIISYRRDLDNKSDNEYLIINTDEPYALEIVEILKKNGHWG